MENISIKGLPPPESKAEPHIIKETEEDLYYIIKGKALVLTREFKKVYPNASDYDISTRITDEVWTAANQVIKDTKCIQTERLHAIIREIKSLENK